MAKILFRSFALLVLLGGVVNAADLPIGTPVYAPAVVAPNTWEGIYVGLNLGGHWLIDQVSTTNLPNGGSSSGTLNAPGVIGGLQAGYNWQFGNVVAGIEADANVLSADAVRNDTAFALTNGIKSPGFLLTVRPRLGWAFDHRTLVYATAGYAFETVQVVDTANLGQFVGSSVIGRQSGWAAGAGFEYAFSRGVSAKIEYLYLGLGTINSTILPNPAGVATNVNVTHKLSDNIVRAGVNFHLGY
jgi:outer membrane immunogenic protein